MSIRIGAPIQERLDSAALCLSLALYIVGQCRIAARLGQILNAAGNHQIKWIGNCRSQQVPDDETALLRLRATELTW
ncbi:MAG: hypothetical protein JWR51_76 [Devosia sp.]|nr:hypothetical protein [Devosia sp.]